MRNKLLVVLLSLVILNGCSKKIATIKAPIEYTTFFVITISQTDSIIISISYDGAEIKNIVKKANLKDQKYLHDSTLFSSSKFS
jgi:hypothetical protein